MNRVRRALNHLETVSLQGDRIHAARIVLGLAALFLALCGCTEAGTGAAASCQPDAYTRNDGVRAPGPAEIHLTNDISPVNTDGLVNVVVEIPSGTNVKWEVSKADGTLRIDQQNGEPRIIDYLPYPANYGMVPQSYLPESAGGDGDPLDVVVLGSAIPRGCIVGTEIIGVLHLVDQGERDDKLIAVYPGSSLSRVATLEDLEEWYPGIPDILETWFTSYKGKDQSHSNGFGSREDALAILDEAIDAYRLSVSAPDDNL